MSGLKPGKYQGPKPDTFTALKFILGGIKENAR